MLAGVGRTGLLVMLSPEGELGSASEEPVGQMLRQRTLEI